MKFLIHSLLLVFLVVSCTDNKQRSNADNSLTENILVNKVPTLKGTWELRGFYNYRDNKIVDSFSNNTISRQIKMFTDSKVMWCKLIKQDSTEFFGYGKYKIEDGQLVEVLDFGSNFMNQVISERKEFKFHLQLREDSFEKIEFDEDGNKVYSENYIRIE